METEVRLLPKFDYFVPSSIGEVLEVLEEHQEKARLLAGGTDLMFKLKKHVVLPEAIVDLNRITELSYINMVGDHLHIGALTRLAQIQKSPMVKERASALVQAISVMASPPIRNRATLAGNLCTASPAADTAPPLLALDASVKLLNTNGERIIPLSQFFIGPEQHVASAREILVEIIIPLQEGASAFIKLGRRKAFTLSVVSAAAFALESNGRFEEVRVALGAVAPTPMRSLKIEEALRGMEIGDRNVERCAELVRMEVKPITDLRASSEYRKQMSYVLTKRVLQKVAPGGEDVNTI